MKKLLPFVLLILLIHPFAGHTQKSHQLGLIWLNEKDGDHTYAPGLGIQFVMGLGRFTGVETGLYYKLYASSFMGVDENSNFFTADNITRNLVLPAHFRFGHRWLMIEAGGDCVFNLSSVIKDKLSPLADFSVTTRSFTLRPILGISSPWKIKKKWVIEPGITASSPIPDGGVEWGLNIAFRKILH